MSRRFCRTSSQMKSIRPRAGMPILKEQVISAYHNQLIASQNWLYSFVKKNEFFWLYSYATNLALNATVTDSSEAPGQPGTAAINGVVDGYPNNWPQEWASVRQLA